METLSKRKNGSILSYGVILMPVSSKTSRITERSMLSLGSMWPPGRTQAFGNFRMYYGLRDNKIFPSESIIAIQTADFYRFSENFMGTSASLQFSAKVRFGQEFECAKGKLYVFEFSINSLYF
jgi:hypothetical protein